MAENEKDFISLVIPAFNTGKYLARCLDSVLKACDPDCEVIIVDDASTDDTAEVADRYMQRDPRVYLVRLDEHAGAAAARLRGVSEAQGEWIFFVDSDDTLPADAITALRGMISPDVDIIAGNMTIVENGSRSLSLTGQKFDMKGKEFAEYVMTNEVSVLLIGKMYRRTLFDNMFWDTAPIYGGIYHRMLLLSMACAARKVRVNPAAHVYNYLKRPFTLSALIYVRPDSVSRLWQAVATLPVSRKALLYWGLHIIDKYLINRGIPFDNELLPAVELRNLMLSEKVDNPKLAEIGKLLYSEKKRLKYTQKLLREGQLSVPAPHVSFIICADRNARDVRKTVHSILDSGLRNIEIVIIDPDNDDRTSVELQRIAVFVPRVVLEKSPEGVPTRLTGLRTARGLATMFVDAGDGVDAHGISDAFSLINTGAQLVFMATRFDFMRGMKKEVYDPSKCIPVHQGAQATYDSLSSMGEMLAMVYGVAFDRRFLMENRNSIADIEYDMQYRTLMLLNLLSIKPHIAATGIVGYYRHTVYPHRRLTERISSYYTLGVGILWNLHRTGNDDPGHMRSTAMGITGHVQRTLAHMMTLPMIGHMRARKFITRLLESPEAKKFYDEAGIEHPDADTVMTKSKAHYNRHFWRYLLEFLTGD